MRLFLFLVSISYLICSARASFYFRKVPSDAYFKFSVENLTRSFREGEVVNNLFLAASSNDTSDFMIHLNTLDTEFQNAKHVDVIRKDGSLAHLAARHGNLEILEALASHQANFDLKNPQGHTPLQVSLEFEQLAFTAELVRKGAKINYPIGVHPNLLFMAVFKKLPDLISAIFSTYAGTATLEDLCADHLMYEGSGIRLVHLAALRQNIEVLDLLNQFRRDLEVIDRNGNTALSLAAQAQNLQAMLKLVSLGVHVDYPVAEYANLIYLAVSNNLIVLLKEIRLAGHDIKTICSEFEHESPLEVAIKNEFFDIAVFLIKVGSHIKLYKLEILLNKAIKSGNEKLTGFLRETFDYLSHREKVEESHIHDLAFSALLSKSSQDLQALKLKLS